MFLVHGFYHAMILAIITTVMAEEKTCDLLGEQEQESSKELALMNRLKPLFNQRYNVNGFQIKQIRLGNVSLLNARSRKHCNEIRKVVEYQS